MDHSTDQMKHRLAKLDELKQMGVNPYSNRPFDNRVPIITVLEMPEAEKSKAELENVETNLSIAGRIVLFRKFGKAAFAHIADGSGKIQIYIKKDSISAEAFAVFKKLDIGDYLSITGKLFRTRTDELSIEVARLRLLTKALRPLPEKWHGLTDIETRCRQRYLDLIANPEVMDIFKKRSRIINFIRDFLVKREFLEVETPMMHPTPGGAAAKPFVTHHNSLHTDLYLRIAPELYLKRLIVGGFERVFEINRNFRNEGISNIHNPEFTMLEFYVAYKDYNYLIELTEELISSMAEEITGGSTVDYQGGTINFKSPWTKIGYYDALIQFSGLKQEELGDIEKLRSKAGELGVPVKDASTVMDITNDIFEEAVEKNLINPTFITGYPIEISPLARRSDADSNITDRFELFVAGREIANAFSELNDPVDQRSRFEAQAKRKEAGDDEAHDVDEDYLRALEHGMAPTAGEGIGIDRLVMLLANQSSIRDVILFPQMKRKE